MGLIRLQTSARLIIQTNIDFGAISISAVKICYRDPNGYKGEWDASQLAGGSATGKIYVDFSDTVNFHIPGVWKLEAKIILSNAKILLGEIAQYTVSDNLLKL